MKITKNIKNLLIGLVILIIIGIFFFMRSKNASKYMVPEPSTVPSDYNSLYAIYNQRLLTCADTYNMSTKDATALSTYNTCLSSNVLFLTSNSCPAIISTTSGGVTSRTYTSYESCNADNAGKPADSIKYCSDAATWTSSNSDFTTQQTTIRNAYVDMISRAGLTAGTSTYPAQNIIEAARTADMRAASNKYLATLCPSFFRTQSNTAAGVYTTHNPTTYFSGYTTTATASSTYYLDDTNRLNALGGTTPGQSAAANLTAWAKNAGNTDNEMATASAAITGAVGSRWVDATTADGWNGSAVTNELGTTTCAIPNWVMALYFGPGTIVKPDGTNKIPITWRVDANTTRTCYYTPPSNGIVHKA